MSTARRSRVRTECPRPARGTGRRSPGPVGPARRRPRRCPGRRRRVLAARCGPVRRSRRTCRPPPRSGRVARESGNAGCRANNRAGLAGLGRQPMACRRNWAASVRCGRGSHREPGRASARGGPAPHREPAAAAAGWAIASIGAQGTPQCGCPQAGRHRVVLHPLCVNGVCGSTFHVDTRTPQD